MKTFITIASAMFASFAMISPCAADDPPQSRTVQFADLDLSKTEDAAALFTRIRAAAKSVCDGYRSRELLRQRRYVACIELAVSDAVARVDEPVLTDYFAKRTSGSKSPARIASRR